MKMFAMSSLAVMTMGMGTTLGAIGVSQHELPVTDRVVLEATSSLPTASAYWKVGKEAGPTDSIRLVLVMKRSTQALEELEQIFWAVSDPQGSEYGKHLSQSEVTSIVSPPQTTLENVLGYFVDEGAYDTSTGAHGDLFSFSMNVADAERVFNTTLHYFVPQDVTETVLQVIRAVTPYSIKSSLADDILLVDGLLRLPQVLQPLPMESEISSDVNEIENKDRDIYDAAWPTDCGTHNLAKYVTPAVLRQAYSIPDNAAPSKAEAKGKIAVAEFQGEYWNAEDLVDFGKACSLGTNLSVDEQIGDNRPSRCEIPIIISPPECKETLLDIMTIKGMVGGIPLTDIYNKGYSILNWAKQVEDMADEDIPYVHSVSYGRDESQETGDEYIQAVNTEFQKLGVRGLSLLFASGDGGTNGREGGWKHFHAGFPASSPYVTAVGGTNFLEKDIIGSETTWSGSGGGFSDHFAIPDYQSKDVAGYLAAANDTYPPPTAYNSSGRGFPDVSALGGGSNQYLIYEYHKPGGAYGTSAATPLVASVFALLNELRLNASKPPMGFLNPFIYQNKQAFNDVTSGINCGSPAFCQHLKGGFPATVGWDPATGVGTPNYAELAKLV